jgi:hypothetical protein
MLRCRYFWCYAVHFLLLLDTRSWSYWHIFIDASTNWRADFFLTVQRQHIISHHTISYHIKSYHTISYHIISYHTISYHVMSYHIESYHIIISHHTMPYHTIPYHIISYHFLSISCYCNDKLWSKLTTITARNGHRNFRFTCANMKK